MDDALILAIVSIFCAGIIVAPVALAKARDADTPALSKQDRARLQNARAIAWAALAMWALGLGAQLVVLASR